MLNFNKVVAFGALMKKHTKLTALSSPVYLAVGCLPAINAEIIDIWNALGLAYYIFQIT